MKYEVVVRDALAMRRNARPRRQRLAATAVWAFWKRRQDLAPDFAVRMSLRVDVDVPFARRKLSVLLCRQSCPPDDRVVHRAALFGERN